MNETSSGLVRTAQVVKFLLKYRNAGVFSGLDADHATPAPGSDAAVATDGTPEAFVTDLEALGPTFIKVGQSLSTRPDMVPPAYITALMRMQDNVAPLPAADVRAVIEEELGAKVTTLFSEFDDDPIGSASLAQVHRARLRDG
ncbi:MAG: AarF/UbiB family protein, partial [Thermomonas sp.]